MDDPQWSLLKQCLLERGWTPRGDALVAPHQTMWFALDTERPSLASFRDKVSLGAERVGAHAPVDVDHENVHKDLVSLVEALDDALEN